MAESQATSARMAAPRRRRPPARRPSPATKRRPPARKGPDLVDRGIDAVGRGVARLGKATGRALGRTREIDPAHRRDGLGVALIVLAVVSAAGIWFGAGGPIGRGISAGIGFVVGRGAVVLPILLAVAGVVLMVTEPRPDWYLMTRGELVELFAEAKIVDEKVWGLTKSIMAVKTA